MFVNAYYFYQSEDLMNECSIDCQIDLGNGEVLGVNRDDAPDWMKYEFVWVDRDFDIIWENGRCFVLKPDQVKKALGLE